MSKPKPSIEEVLEEVVARDARYPLDAYQFLREALDFTVHRLKRTEKTGDERHVTGQELLEGFRDLALAQFGPLALTVLRAWNVHRGEDVGELVFNMVESGVLGKTARDSRDDFKGGPDLEAALGDPFKPSPRGARRKCAPSARPQTP